MELIPKGKQMYDSYALADVISMIYFVFPDVLWMANDVARQLIRYHNIGVKSMDTHKNFIQNSRNLAFFEKPLSVKRSGHFNLQGTRPKNPPCTFGDEKWPKIRVYRSSNLWNMSKIYYKSSFFITSWPIEPHNALKSNTNTQINAFPAI